jgi:beta-N-acetylhexosaminidase
VRRLQAAATRSSGVGLSVAVDQEGGRVQTLTGAGFSTLPPASVQQGWTTARLGATWGRTARQLRAAGVTMNLAPVADTVPAGTERFNPPIGAVGRHYGRSPGPVGTRVGVVAAGLEANGVAATLKHFPGLGRVRRNTDTSTGAVDSRYSTRDPHLEPFVDGIRAGADVIMISSASYPRLDPDRPAVFSPRVIDGLLRTRLGYRGVVLSDDLGAAAAVRRVPLGQRAVRFVAAGGDQTLSVRTSDAGPLVDALASRARRSPGFRSRVDAAALRVLTLKADTGVLECTRSVPVTPRESSGPDRSDQGP